jgi:NodT family efflux transporter outer membrane factor (OMF) lipoprotein
MRRGPLFALPLALLATACTVGPTYRAPQLPTPPAYAEAASTQRLQITPADADLSRWWTQFGDPLLDALVTEALAGNPDIATADSRVREAREQETVASAAEYPTLNGTTNALTLNSNRSSGSGAAGAGSSGIRIPSHTNLYSAGFDATWELDLFGGTRRSIEEARANTDSYRWAERDTRVSLVAEVANDYLTLRALQARIAVGQAELRRQKDLFTLIAARRKTGFVTNLDVNQQSTAVATAAAEIPQLQAQAKAEIHAIGVLLGQPPEALTARLAATGAALPPPPPTLPTGLPSELLRRRPDIRRAERRLAASNAEIGVRTANLYPKVNLIGLASFAGTSLDSLFSHQNLTSIGVAMASVPIFDAGKTRASIRVAREENRQAEIAYQTAILIALRDVEDALARYSAEETRRTSLAQSVVAAQGSLKIAQDQYRTGFVTFINVLTAENTLLNAEDQLTQSDAQVATDLVAIYKALGGGWTS